MTDPSLRETLEELERELEAEQPEQASAPAANNDQEGRKDNT